MYYICIIIIIFIVYIVAYSGVITIFINTFIMQGCIKKQIKKQDNKTFIMLQMIFISNKCCSFERSQQVKLIQRKLKYSAAQLLIIIRMFLKQQISLLESFLKDHMTLKTRVMMLPSQE